MQKPIIKTLSGLACIGSVAWAFSEPGFESIIAVLASGGAFISCFVFQKVKKHLYDRDNAFRFYGKICEKYDERNTKFLKNSHIITVQNLKEAVLGLEEASILDLGGGTGINVAAHFFNRTNVTWHYIDITTEMRVAFEKNVSSASFSYNATTSDINKFITQCNETYDAIVISFVLTSLPYSIDMNKLARLLKDGGSLVIADIEPQYTEKHPEYSVNIDGEVYSLTVSPVNALDLIEAAIKENLTFKYCQSIKKDDGERYAYVLRFFK